MIPPTSVHRPSVDENKAPGAFWVRICQDLSLLTEYRINTVTDADNTAVVQINNALTAKPREPVLTYIYSGTSGECLNTITTIFDQGKRLSLSSVGFVPIDSPDASNSLEASREAPDFPPTLQPSPNDFTQQWASIDDQRLLIKTINGGYPSPYERFLAKTICQFLIRNGVSATLLEITSQYSPAIPHLPPATTVHLALILPEAQTKLAKLLDLDIAIDLLYDQKVQCQIHIYQPSQIPVRSLHEYLHSQYRADTPSSFIFSVTPKGLRHYLTYLHD